MYLCMCVQCTYTDDHNAAKVSRKTAPFGGLGINSGLQPHILKLICDLLDRWDEKLLMSDARTVVGSGMRSSFCIYRLKDNDSNSGSQMMIFYFISSAMNI